MTDKEKIKIWMAQRATEDEQLYELYGKALEQEHKGEFVAISSDGQTITGSDELTVASQALKRFGPGTFALRRIGADAEIRWRHHL